jgi:hypothetical protein
MVCGCFQLKRPKLTILKEGGKEDAEKIVDGCGIAFGDAGFAFHGFLSEESGRSGPTGPGAHGST